MKKTCAILLSIILSLCSIISVSCADTSKSETVSESKHNLQEIIDDVLGNPLYFERFDEQMELLKYSTPATLQDFILLYTNGYSALDDLTQYAYVTILYLIPLLHDTPLRLGDRPLKIDDYGTDVAELQFILKMLGLYTDYIDGSFGGETNHSSESLHSIAGFEDDSVLDVDEANAIKASYFEILGDEAVEFRNIREMITYLISHTYETLRDLLSLRGGPRHVLGDREIHEGDKGTDIIELQFSLNYLGLYFDQIDGRFGPVTKQAIKDFQTLCGLDPDGEVTPEFTVALYNATRDKYLSELENKKL